MFSTGRGETLRGPWSCVPSWIPVPAIERERPGPRREPLAFQLPLPAPPTRGLTKRGDPVGHAGHAARRPILIRVSDAIPKVLDCNRKSSI